MKESQGERERKEKKVNFKELVHMICRGRQVRQVGQSLREELMPQLECKGSSETEFPLLWVPSVFFSMVFKGLDDAHPHYGE